MRSDPGDYEMIEATDLAHALELLRSQGDWRPIAGGTDIMVLFNAGLLTYHRLVSIRKIPELTKISETSDTILIGGAVTYRELLNNELIGREFPLLRKSSGWTGSVANQNRGTLGGNIANGSPAADSPPALLVYDASLDLVSARGQRRVSYSDFHKAYKKMDLLPDELILAIHLPRRTANLRQYARKVGARRAQAISKVCFYGTAGMEGDRVREIRVALGSVAPIPIRCHRVEKLLTGEKLTPSVIVASREAISTDVQPIDDIRSTASYRKQVSQNLLGEFLEQLL